MFWLLFCLSLFFAQWATLITDSVLLWHTVFMFTQTHINGIQKGDSVLFELDLANKFWGFFPPRFEVVDQKKPLAVAKPSDEDTKCHNLIFQKLHEFRKFQNVWESLLHNLNILTFSFGGLSLSSGGKNGNHIRDWNYNNDKFHLKWWTNLPWKPGWVGDGRSNCRI